MTSTLKGKFFLEGKDFFPLKRDIQLPEHPMQVKVDSEILTLNKEQSLLLSELFVEFYQEDPSIPYEILLPQPGIDPDNLSSVLKQLSALFENTDQFVIDDTNFNSMKFLGTRLKNRDISQLCNLYETQPDGQKNQVFTIRSSRFNQVLPEYLSYLNNFKITVFDKVFDVNRYYFNCLTNDAFKGQDAVNISEVQGVDANKFLECAEAFLGVLKGQPVLLQDYQPDILAKIKEVFGIDFSSKVRGGSSDLDDQIEGALQILRDNPSEEEVQKAADFIAIYFANVKKNILLGLPEPNFDKIIKSKFLILPDATYLFDMLKPLIQKDSSKLYLLDNLKMGEVTHESLWEYMSSLTFETFDENIWKFMQKSITENYLNPLTNCPYPMSRWEEPPHLSTQREAWKQFALIDRYRTGGKSREETVKELQKKQEDMKKDNELLKSRLEARMKVLVNQGIYQLKNVKEKPENRQKAADVLRQIGEKGSIPGKWMFGACLIRGIGVDPDHAKAKTFLESAVQEASKTETKDGLKEAKFWLTFLTDDPVQKTSVLKELHDQEFKPGMWWYGKQLFEGEGVEKDRETGRNLLQKVAESGDAFWARHHARIIREGRFDFRKNENEAEKFENLANGKEVDHISYFNPGLFEDMNP